MDERPAKTQISLGIHPVWPESSLALNSSNSEGSDQTGRMPRLIRVFTGRTRHFVCNAWSPSPWKTVFSGYMRTAENQIRPRIREMWFILVKWSPGVLTVANIPLSECNHRESKNSVGEWGVGLLLVVGMGGGGGGGERVEQAKWEYLEIVCRLTVETRTRFHVAIALKSGLISTYRH